MWFGLVLERAEYAMARSIQIFKQNNHRNTHLYQWHCIVIFNTASITMLYILPKTLKRKKVWPFISYACAVWIIHIFQQDYSHLFTSIRVVSIQIFYQELAPFLYRKQLTNWSHVLMNLRTWFFCFLRLYSAAHDERKIVWNELESTWNALISKG